MKLPTHSGMAFWSAGTVIAVGLALALPHTPGPHAGHMAVHVILMNILAPLLAVLAASRLQLPATAPAALWIAALVQLTLLWGAHLPAIQDQVMAHHAVRLMTDGALLLAASAFWIALMTLGDRARWHGVAALALTGKLVCLLAVLLVFAPRSLYQASHAHHGPATLDDQQLAGLIMIAACPSSYLVAAVILVVRLLFPERARSVVTVPSS